jgi:transglutaminase-like putative cysteine protease
MYQRIPRRCRTTVAVACLVLAATGADGQEAATAEPGDVSTAAHRLAGEILEPDDSRRRLPLALDVEHARTIDPVLTRGTAIWIHEELPSPPLTVVGGRVFSYRDHVYDPLETPVLKIRPTDDDEVVPFLVRVVVTPDRGIQDDAAVTLAFPAPPIFKPRLERVRAWVGSKPAQISIERSFDESMITVRVPLGTADGKPHSNLTSPVVVIVQGDLRLGAYRWVAANRFTDLETYEMDPDIAGLAQLEVGRDITERDEREQLDQIAEFLASKSPTSYGRVIAVNSWVSSRLQYQESPVTRSAVEALEDRAGDCGEYTTVMVALLRAMGIPARRATGRLYDFNTLSAHAWVEVALPKRNGDLHWFLADPTFAGTTAIEEEKAAYVQFNDRMLLYPVKPIIRLEGTTARRSSDIFLNRRKKDEEQFAEPAEADTFIEIAIATIDQEISSGAQRLKDGELLLRRESASIVGSPYVIVDRPLTQESSNRIQVRLENDERLVLDLTAGTSSEIDAESMTILRSGYHDLNNHFFAGEPAFHNLELIFIRDRHSDRLHTVSLRFGRYLVEHSLARILKRLEKGGFLTEEEKLRISKVAEASGGKNLYLLQELARQLPKSAEGAKDE